MTEPTNRTPIGTLPEVTVDDRTNFSVLCDLIRDCDQIIRRKEAYPPTFVKEVQKLAIYTADVIKVIARRRAETALAVFDWNHNERSPVDEDAWRGLREFTTD